jgi:DNA-binding MarR family transcriptional regulator
MAQVTRNFVEISRMRPTKKTTSHKGKSVKARSPNLVHDALVSTQINLAARLTNQAARLRLGELGAWPGQIPILLWLLEEDGIIQKDLVRRVNMEQSTVAEHLDRMESCGLLYRRQGDIDKRKYRIFLTERARAIAPDMIAELEEGARIFTKGISRQELKLFHGIILKIVNNLYSYIRAHEERTEARHKPRAKPRSTKKPRATKSTKDVRAASAA